MDILIDLAKWTVKGAGFALGWAITQALLALV